MNPHPRSLTRYGQWKVYIATGMEACGLRNGDQPCLFGGWTGDELLEPTRIGNRVVLLGNGYPFTALRFQEGPVDTPASWVADLRRLLGL